MYWKVLGLFIEDSIGYATVHVFVTRVGRAVPLQASHSHPVLFRTTFLPRAAMAKSAALASVGVCAKTRGMRDDHPREVVQASVSD